jgi:hypothetical protein
MSQPTRLDALEFDDFKAQWLLKISRTPAQQPTAPAQPQQTDLFTAARRQAERQDAK